MCVSLVLNLSADTSYVPENERLVAKAPIYLIVAVVSDNPHYIG